MTLSDSRRITDELLSAYIDDEVTEQERAFIEAAIAQDQEIAWRLHSLRQTVTLLRDLPELTLSRSFALTAEQLQMAAPQTELLSDAAASGAAAAGHAGAVVPALTPRVLPQSAPTRQNKAGFWEQLTTGWRGFWQAGNPVLRNAAAVSFALMLLLVGSNEVLNQTQQPDSVMVSAPAASSESVALVPSDTAASAPPSEAQPAQGADSAQKLPAEESEESAVAMQAPATSADQAQTESTASSAERATVVDEAEDEAVESDSAVQAGEAAIAEAAPAGEEPAAAAAMAAPEQGDSGQAAPEQAEELAPLVEVPFPGPGVGAGGMGGGADAPPGGAADTGLLPEQAFEFDVDPLAEPTTIPAEEAVVASAGAAPAEEAAPQSAANIAGTPAVDAVDTPEAEAASAARSAAAPETPAQPAADTTQSDAADADTTEADAPLDAEATPEAVALVAPEAITSSAVVENAESGEVATTTGYALNMPLVTIAQGSALLLTVVFASLWWRSRTSRRPRR